MWCKLLAWRWSNRSICWERNAMSFGGSPTQTGPPPALFGYYDIDPSAASMRLSGYGGIPVPRVVM